jgi:hypothetical protein
MAVIFEMLKQDMENPPETGDNEIIVASLSVLAFL